MTASNADQPAVTRVYERMASIYDIYDGAMDLMGGASRRRRVVGHARGVTLEVGIGTGRNFEHYPPGLALTGIDVSGRMLERARERALRLGRSVRLLQADIQALPFEDGAFDTVVATCVFCSVADPLRGLAEVRRVVRPDGIVLLLEHVRPDNPVLGRLADLATPFSRRLFGSEMNRRTEATVAKAGLETLEVRRETIWREMVCRRSPAAADRAPEEPLNLGGSRPCTEFAGDECECEIALPRPARSREWLTVALLECARSHQVVERTSPVQRHCSDCRRALKPSRSVEAWRRQRSGAA